ncbi:MAG: RNA 2',3'-cyclic phosphodiesterase [Dysosmobacter welbionis]
MRLFLAIQLSPAVREALLTAQDALRRQGRGSFPPPENLHLTLAFLGEAEDLTRARAALSEVSCRPFSLAVGGPPGHFGDLLWAGVRADPALEELAVSLQADLRSRGFCQEDRPWLPHITLVRRWRARSAGDRPPREHGGPADLLLRSDQIDGKRIYTELSHKSLR